MSANMELIPTKHTRSGRVGNLGHWLGLDRNVPAGFESHCGKLRFGTLAIRFTPALPVSFGGDTKSRKLSQPRDTACDVTGKLRTML